MVQTEISHFIMQYVFQLIHLLFMVWHNGNDEYVH